MLLPLSSNAQDIFYRSTSNIVVANTTKGSIDIGISHEFGNQQAQLIYNLTEKHFVFGTYNINNSNYTYNTFFGDERAAENHNSGFTIGGGIQKLGRIGSYNNLELLAGFEMQHVKNLEYSPNYNPEDKDHLVQDYFKLFAQFNMMKNRTNFDFGYSLKFGFLKFTKFEYNNYESDFNGKSVFLLDPTLNFNYKFLPKRNLILTSQIGFSTALNNIVNTETNGSLTTVSSTFIVSGILKFGIQYRFTLKTKDQL